MKADSSSSLPSNLLAEEIKNTIYEIFHASLTFQRCIIALREEYLSKKKYQPDRAIAIGMSVTQYKMDIKARVYIVGVLKERY